MVVPLLPVYAKDLGANGIWLGLTFSSFAIVQAIAGPAIGRIIRTGTRESRLSSDWAGGVPDRGARVPDGGELLPGDRIPGV